MEKQLFTILNLISLAIVLLLTSTTITCKGNNPNHNGESDDALKQHRLFMKHWMKPQDHSEELSDELQQEKVEMDQLKNMFMKDLSPNVPLNPLFEMNEHKKHKVAPFPDSNYDYDYSSERDLDSTLPYGIQNVLPDPARLPRSKTRITRIKFQSLCPSKRETIFLNLDTEFEYRPDHYEEVTCAHPYIPFHEKPSSKAVSPVCGEAGFSCIQLNRTIFLTRRAYGADCWESETRLVPAGCECMWPKHYFGDISAHH